MGELLAVVFEIRLDRVLTAFERMLVVLMTAVEALRELDRLSKMPVAAAEYTVSRTYLDWLVMLPWAKRTDEVIDLGKTLHVLDADHSGLEKAKDRILEYLAVRKLNPSVKGPILCFVGPPGVGKTSLAKSIALSLDRKFVRV